MDERLVMDMFSGIEMRLLLLEKRLNKLTEKPKRERPEGAGLPSMIQSVDETGRRFTDPEKVDKVRLVQRMYAKGNHSFKSLAHLLNESGEASSMGKKWHAGTIAKAVQMKLPEEI